MTHKIMEHILSSPLAPLLDEKTVTDITFNGQDIYFQDSLTGRNKSAIVLSQEQAMSFIRQIANLSGQQFSVQDPILDLSVEYIRINAVHPSIGRLNYQGSVTFAIRKRTSQLVNYQDGKFMPKVVEELLIAFLTAHYSLVISGVTGSGKTELQKYLLGKLKRASRVIVIDNILELEDVRNENIDLTIWESNDWHPKASFSHLIRNGLRAHPDWLIVAESRGAEMLDVLNAALSGHPLITTMHAQDLHSIPARLTRMVLMGDKNLDYQLVFQDIVHHFPILIHLGIQVNTVGQIERFISGIGYLDEDNNGKLLPIYENKQGQIKYFHLPDKLKERLAKQKSMIDLWEVLC